MEESPRAHGFRMPGEFEEHDCCWILWPERADTWRDGCLPARKAIADVARAIAAFEPVIIGASASQYDNVCSLLQTGKDSNITVRVIESNDSWMRDVGPTFVVKSSNSHGSVDKVRGIDWQFNAWGGLVDGMYLDWSIDDLVAGRVCEMLGLKSYRTTGFVLEGGSIHVDGEGTCITTEACLLSKGRNPHLNKQEIENMLCKYLNVTKVIWLPNGIHGDETNEHVDNIIHFLSPTNVILAWTDDETDRQWHNSQAALKVLENATDALGRHFNITKIHVPEPLYVTQEEHESFGAFNRDTSQIKVGDRLPASYCNCYLANGGVVVPIFGDEIRDTQAIDTLRKLLPEKVVVPVYSREILLGGGNIHCVTQQQPRAPQ